MQSHLRLKIIAIALAISPLSLVPPAGAQDSNSAKAHALVDAAIKMTNGDQAVKLLWQATELDPTQQDAYVYLGLYYQAKSDFANMVKVYQKLAKNEPNQPTAYINIGEAYMSFSPARTQDALVYFRKAYEIDPKNSFAALRIGEILSQSGNSDEAIKYLRQALADSAKSPAVSAEAENALKQMGAL